MKASWIGLLWVVLASLASVVLAEAVPAKGGDWLDACNVVWTTPSENSAGSMPLGNGDIGLNLWVEKGGDLLFYVNKTDAWDAHVRLLKLGRVRVKLSPNPFLEGIPFQQTLRLRQGEIEIVAGQPEKAVTLRIRVDACRPVIRVEAEGKEAFQMQVALESWRTQEYQLTGPLRDAARGLLGAPDPLVVPADTILSRSADRIEWYHRNVTSGWPITMKVQGLEGIVKPSDDPILHRTFGARIKGEGMVKDGSMTLKSAKPARRHSAAIYALTKAPATEAEWLAALDALVAAVDAVPVEQARREHLAWWDEFWNRSWIRVSGAVQGPEITQGYALQRFINACGGRGAMPIKFNGSIFTVDAMKSDGDYRRWGSCYWWQNTRLPYWAMIACGDFDLMQPLFAMYVDALPLSKGTTKTYYNHDGAFFAETMYFWGTPCNDDFGWNRNGHPQSLMINQYIRYYWQGGLELSKMMLDCYEHAQDEKLARQTLVPFADAIVTFYDKHYPRGPDGKLRFEPSQSLETWWKAVNPLPEIAGLRSVLQGLLSLPADVTSQEQRGRWKRLAAQIPPIPTRQAEGHTLLAAAQEFSSRNNCENPELYAIFPYRLYGVGKPDLEMARASFAERMVKGSQGWQQDPVQSALLGLADQAAKFVSHRFATKDPGSRFPAFWGPNFDWTPDQCHGGNAMLGLQAMILQADGKKILLLPAWPKGWNVQFKLHAPQKTTVAGVYRDGKWEQLVVTPESRAADVVKVESQ